MTDNKTTSIKAAPGIYLIKLIDTLSKSTVNIGDTKQKNIIKGEIIDVGLNRSHDNGGEMIATLKKGTLVWFLSFVDNADWFEEDKEKYYSVLFHDIRAYKE
jgi:co-chaperonin GroES (HSP10)